MTIDLSALRLPELRFNLLDMVQSPIYFKNLERLQPAHPIPGMSIVDQVQLEAAGLKSADLYYIAPRMIALAETAARSLPEFGLEPEDIPATAGMMFFDESPLVVPHGEPSISHSVCAVVWLTHKRGVLLSFYTDRDDMIEAQVRASICTPQNAAYSRSLMAPLVRLTGRDTLVPFHTRGADENAMVLNDAVRTVRSVWLLMQQPLASVTEATPDRASAKRIRRAGLEPAPVRVIELRRPKGSGARSDGTRDFIHQWIVRGHWRQQWYPARQVHRPVWIAPHIKGPEGAPMIGGEKVYSLKRE